jgi:hypothetical protein
MGDLKKKAIEFTIKEKAIFINAKLPTELQESK